MVLPRQSTCLLIVLVRIPGHALRMSELPICNKYLQNVFRGVASRQLNQATKSAGHIGLLAWRGANAVQHTLDILV